jgi:hypothetical protein
VWEPFGVADVERLLGDAEFVWWLSGGVALDVFLGRRTRAHGDIDVSVRRSDWPALHAFLDGRLDVKVAHNGVLSDVPDGALDDEVNGLWARNDPGGPWRLQINLEHSEADDWVFRRDPRIRRPLREVVWRRAELPYVNPAVQLIWKVASTRARDEQDFAAVVPSLPDEERRWLAEVIELGYPTSPWAARVRAAVDAHLDAGLTVEGQRYRIRE